MVISQAAVTSPQTSASDSTAQSRSSSSDMRLLRLPPLSAPSSPPTRASSTLHSAVPGGTLGVVVWALVPLGAGGAKLAITHIFDQPQGRLQLRLRSTFGPDKF